MSVPFLNLHVSDPAIRAEIDAVLKKLLDTASYIGGDEVRLFAEEFGRYSGGGHCVPVANGTDALIVALKALGVGPGDEVITVPFTFIATSEAISYVGAQVKFIDIDPQTYTMDPALIEKAISKKTKALIPVHLFGQPADMDPIMAIAQKHGLKVVEDAAQAHGAEYKGRRVGTLGDIACFSFYPTKNLGGFGDGGAVVSPSKDLADKVLQLANHGRTEQYFHAVEGINSRLDSIQAAVLRILLKRLDGWNDRRRAIAQAYDAAVAQKKGFKPPQVAAYARPVYHLYSLETSVREAFMAHLKKLGIGHGVYYPLPLHLQPAYARLGLKEGAFPVSERASQHILSLPMFPSMTDAQVQEVCAAIASFS